MNTTTATSTQVCRFEPLDTWFFRESRPHGSVGSSELGSVFPPPVRTLLGALRTLIGDAWYARHGDDWHNFGSNKALQAIIGYGDDLGSLHVSGPFLALDGKRLYPAPANLMVKEANGTPHYFLLDLGDPVHCDLGKVHLPCFPAQVPNVQELVGSKPAERCWLTADGLQKILQGQAPEASQIIEQKQLFQEENRLGIGRDNSRKSVQEGLLYQTRHLRLTQGVAIELRLHGLADAELLPTHTTIRLGGEGRQAALHVCQGQDSSIQPAVDLEDSPSAFALYNLTPVCCAPGLPAGIPKGFQRVQRSDGVDVWEGSLGGIDLRILGVACGRPLREGGWDMATHQARPVHSLLPPGSVLYVQAQAAASLTLKTVQQALNTLTDATGRNLWIAGRLPTNSTFKG